MDATETITLTAQPESIMVDAVNTHGDPMVLASDPDGDYFIVEQLQFRNGPRHLVAHRVGPGDRLKPGVARFASMQPVG
jgi:hypothetical protein